MTPTWWPIGERDEPRGDRRLRWCGLPLLVLALAVALAAVQAFAWPGGIQAQGGLAVYVRGTTDFVATLTGATILRDGHGVLLYDLPTQHAAQARVLAPYLRLRPDIVNIYNHPPAEALLVAPLLNLPYGVIFGLWTLLSIGAFGAALWLLSRILPAPAPLKWAMIAVACSYHPVHLALWLGQNSALVLLGLCGAYAALKRRRDGWLGLSLLLIALKPQLLPALVGLLLLQRRWKALAVAAGALAGLSVAAMPVLGVAWPLRYARFLLGASNQGASVAEKPLIMHNWRGLALDLFAGWAPALVTPALAALSLATIGLFLWAWWRSRGPAPAEAARTSATWRGDLLFALACLASVLLAFHLNPHDLVVLIVPAWIGTVYVASGAWGPRAARAWGWIVGCGYALPPLALYLAADTLVPVATSVTLMAAAMLLLAYQCGRARPALEAGCLPDGTAPA